jgi:DNA-binding NtrC family response regulator
MSKIVVVSAAPDRLSDFIEALRTAAGTPLRVAPTAEAALTAAREDAPYLMVIDERVDWPVFALVKEIMMVNAMIHTAVISSQSADAFHDTAEGLGILMQLPVPPGPLDAATLMNRVGEVTAPLP